MELARSKGIISRTDLVNLAIPTVELTRLVREGALERTTRGVYSFSGKSLGERDSLIRVVSRYPSGVICLLSALQYHELGTQAPFEVWMALPNKARKPKENYPPVRIIRFSDQLLKEGVEQIWLNEFPIRMTNVARTIADCFKYRNKIGLEVPLEALREAWQDKRVTMDALWHYAELCRVSNVMRPYLESLT